MLGFRAWKKDASKPVRRIGFKTERRGAEYKFTEFAGGYGSKCKIVLGIRCKQIIQFHKYRYSFYPIHIRSNIEVPSRFYRLCDSIKLVWIQWNGVV